MNTNDSNELITEDTRQEDKFPSRDSRVWQDSLETTKTISTNYSVTADDDYLLVDTTSGSVTITLPSAASGRKLTVQRIAGANNVILETSGADTIDGATTFTVSDTRRSVTIKSTHAGYITVTRPGLLSSDIGVTVQAYDSTILVDADIGVTVQAYDADIPTVSASQAEMETGTETALRSMSPQRVAQAIAALVPPPSRVWSTKAADYTASAGDAIIAGTGGGSWTLTLPATASVGDTIVVVDRSSSFDLHALTISGNGLPIMGLSEDLIVDVENAAFELVYSGATYGWRIL